MLLEGTQKEKILADAGEELRFGVSALGTGVPGPQWEMNPYEMWARGRGDPKNVSSGLPCSSFMLLCKKKEELGGGRGQEISGHHEEK